MTIPRVSALLLLGVLLALPAWGDWQFVATREDDTFTWKDEVLVVESALGIGEVDIRPVDESWPDTFRVRFLYASGKGMSRLESLTLKGTGFEASGIWKDGSGDWQVNTNSTAPSLEAHWEFVDGTVELVITSHQLGLSKDSLRIQWIDAYRR